ncbi:MAG TPA: hypothetical protein VJH97_04680 [Candidatus Nanoarchaeia archaeon]|nr:hypothetical protein [Candidatus Nanoarchaeia archaeon]
MVLWYMLVTLPHNITESKGMRFIKGYIKNQAQHHALNTPGL